jgi:hypothetical protein
MPCRPAADATEVIRGKVIRDEVIRDEVIRDLASEVISAWHAAGPRAGPGARGIRGFGEEENLCYKDFVQQDSEKRRAAIPRRSAG